VTSIIYGYKQYSSGHKWLFERSTVPLSDAPGNATLLSHLKASKNIQKRDELIRGRVVTLYRPDDFAYAKSWAQNTRHILNCERKTILDALSLAETDKSIWLSFE